VAQSTEDPWDAVTKKIEAVRTTLKQKEWGTGPANISVARLLLFISRARGQGAPLSEIHRILRLLQEDISAARDTNSSFEEVGRQWRNLRSVYEIDLDKDAGPFDPLPEIFGKEIDGEMRRLRLKILNKWPESIFGKDAAMGFLKWMPGFKKFDVSEAELRKLLSALDKSIDADEVGTSKHESVKHIWEKIKEDYGVRFFERPDIKGPERPASQVREKTRSESPAASSPPSNRAEKLRAQIRQRMEENRRAREDKVESQGYEEVESESLVEKLQSNLEASHRDDMGRIVVEFLDNLMKEVGFGRYQDDIFREGKYHEDTIAVDLPQELLALQTMRHTLDKVESLIDRHQLRSFVVWDPKKEPKEANMVQWYLGKRERPHKIFLNSYLRRMKAELKRKEDREMFSWEDFQRDRG
jgi:hypothetical protein